MSPELSENEQRKLINTLAHCEMFYIYGLFSPGALSAPDTPDEISCEVRENV